MSAQSSWSLRGVDPRVRDIARSEAKREGVTIGEWLSRQLLEESGESGASFSGAYQDSEAIAAALDRLLRRIEAAEHRSTLAITGIDQSVLDVIARLQSAEELQTAFAERYSAALDELRETQRALHARIERVERDGGDAGGLETLRSLEDALAKVTERVEASEADTRAKLDALKSDMKRAAKRSNNRIDAVSQTLERRMADVERKVEKEFSSVTEIIARQVGDAARQLGRDLGAKTAKLEEDARTARAEIERLETTVTSVGDRLAAAEEVTNAAVQALERTFAELEARVRRAEVEVERLGDPSERDALAAAVEARFEGLSRELAEVVTTTRAEIAGKLAEVARASRGSDAVEAEIEAIAQQVAASEAKQREALARISAKVASLAEAVETQVREAEAFAQARLEENHETVSAARAHMDHAAEIAQLEARLTLAEETSAAAMHAVTRRIDELGDRIAERDDDLSDELVARIRESEHRTRALVEDALATDRPPASELASVMPSPVQRALDALRMRLESLEAARDGEAAPAVTAPAPADRDDADADDDAGDDEPHDPIEGKDVSDREDELQALRALRAPAVAPRESHESRTHDEPFELVYGRSFEDGDRRAAVSGAGPSFDWLKARTTLSGRSVSNLMRAARKAVSAASLRRLVDVGEQMAPGFGPAVASAASRVKKGPGLLFAAGGLAFLAVGAAGVIVLRDPSRANATNDGASDPLDGLYPSPSTAPAQPAPASAVPEEGRRASLTGIPAERSISADVSATPPNVTPARYVESEGPAASIEPASLSADPAPEPARSPLEEAAVRGDPIAQLELGVARIDQGELTEGASLIRAAAENGLAAAQYRLAKLHESGQGVDVDIVAAWRWTERAASAGHRKAMHDLGILYAEGRGAPHDFEKAARWFREAALLGATDAQYNLAVLYENGLGLPLSLSDAYVWFGIAGNAGDEDAAARASTIAGRLTPREREQADLAIHRFAPRPLNETANGIFRDLPWADGPAGESARQALARAQAALAQLGYSPGPPDGIMGRRTAAAISAYQANAGLALTGRVDAALLEKLEADAAAL